MRWTKASKLKDGNLEVPDNWLFPHYYDALNTLFRVENGLRTFVYVVLKSHHHAAWTELTLATDDGGSSTISAISKKRLARDQRFGYLGYAINSPLAHLTSGELIGVILADPYWPQFAQHFPTSKEVVRLKLEEIGNVRNALAHFRPIKPDDVEVVKQNANQVLSGIERLLENAIRTPQDVPSNTADDWYAAFERLNSSMAVDLFQSDDEQWLRVQLTYPCRSIGPSYESASFQHLRLLAPNVSAILRGSSEVSDSVVLCYDYPVYSHSTSANTTPSFAVEVNFTFDRKTFVERHRELAEEFRAIIETMHQDTVLIADDNLVRGRYVRIGGATISSKPSLGWTADRLELATPARSDDPPEFWGSKPFWGDNLLTETPVYPWMRVEVADEPLPF
jgi:hypothetical protein